MIETIILALVLSKIKGYKLKPLFKSWHIYPVLAFPLMYIVLQVMVFMGNYSLIKYGGMLEKLFIFTYLLLIFKYKLYVSAIVGSVFVFVGTLLNKTAISVNGGKMPVFPTLSYLTGYVKPDVFTKVNDIHILGNSEVKLKFLTDIIDIGYSIMSIGDVCIRLFAFIVIYSSIKSINEEKIGNIN